MQYLQLLLIICTIHVRSYIHSHKLVIKHIAKLRWDRTSTIPNGLNRNPTQLDAAVNTFNALTGLTAKLHNNPWYIWTLLSLASSMGLAAEDTRIGAALSSPLITMFTCLLCCNVGILPSASPIYGIVNSFLVPLAIPLLLFEADLRYVLRSSGGLLKAFVIGSIGTLVGTIVAFKLVPMRGLEGAGKIAAALCARHIGGAINFVAVSDILQTSPELIAAALAADNVVVAAYFAFLFVITVANRPNNEDAALTKSLKYELDLLSPVTIQSLSYALSLSFFINLAAQLLNHRYGCSTILSVSVLGVTTATAFPATVKSLSKAGSMGHIPSVMQIAPAVFLHTTVQIVTHFLFSFGMAKVMNISVNDMALASNANVGGPTTAAAMASSKNWKKMVLPAVLTGVFGYSLATGLGLLVYTYLK